MIKIIRIGRKAYKVNTDRFEEFMACVAMTVIVVGGKMWFMANAWWG